MSLPSSNPRGAQSSIRSFFQPKQPAYAPPPNSSAAPPAPPPPPAQQNASRSPPLSVPPATSSDNWPPSGFSAPPPPAAPLHPQASITPIEPEHIPALRRITSLLLPVNYSDSFYASLSDPLSGGAFSRVVLWDDQDGARPKVIGGLVCRPEPSPFHPPSNNTSGPQPNALYIQSLVLLSPYRSLGLAAALLDDVTRNAASGPWACAVVYAHVWTDNTDGLAWYLRRGFDKDREIQGYYFKLRPDSAWIVRRDILHPSGSVLGYTSPNDAPQNHHHMDRSTTAEAANLPAFHNSNNNNNNNGSPATPPVLATTAAVPPPPPSSTAGAGAAQRPPPPAARGMSYQNSRPQTEWNDLPADMHGGQHLGVPSPGASGVSSAASSRSSSATGGRKKKDRSYPAAAFGQ